MRRLGILFTAALCLMLMTACAPQKEGNPVQKITAEEAKEKMDAETVTVVDVRTPEEYEAGHIEGAVNVPLDTIGDTQPALLDDPEAVLLVYCRSGVRSASAARKLAELGYQNLFDFGGILDWPYDTVKGAAQ